MLASRAVRAPPLDVARAAPWSYVLQFSRPLPIEDRTKSGPRRGRRLFDYLGDDPRADGATALSDREPKALVHGDRLDQLDLHLRVLTRRDELAALGELDDAGDVRRAEVELGPVPETKGVWRPPSSFFRQ